MVRIDGSIVFSHGLLLVRSRNPLSVKSKGRTRSTVDAQAVWSCMFCGPIARGEVSLEPAVS